MRRTVRFLLGSDPVELTGVDPTATVLDWLRGPGRRKGTKQGCNEGDCGACTVVVAEPDGASGLRYRPVNACIRFLATLDGCQLLTVEDLKQPDGALHPVQRALVEHHGSQCGFCTPGFVVTMFALQLNGGAASRDEACDALAGNLCRCTGYGPIVDAALAVSGESGRGLNPCEREAKVAARLQAWRDCETLHVTGPDGREFFAPASLDGLLRLRAERPDATVVAGATDVGLWVTKQHRELPAVIYLGNVAELRTIEETEGALDIGAGVTYAEAHEVIAEHFPDAGELIRRLGAWQVREAGTIGGNVANGSPIGDSPPFLIAAGAELVLASQGGRRTMPLEDFFLGYGEQDRKPDEIVERLIIPLPRSGQFLRCYKISKRFDQDISAVCAGFGLTLDDSGVVEEARLAFGGMAATPKRAARAEAALVGKEWSEASVTAAMDVLADDFQPLTDLRASAAYRLKVARNLLLKAYLETAGGAGDLRLTGRGALALDAASAAE